MQDFIVNIPEVNVQRLDQELRVNAHYIGISTGPAGGSIEINGELVPVGGTGINVTVHTDDSAKQPDLDALKALVLAHDPKLLSVQQTKDDDSKKALTAFAQQAPALIDMLNSFNPQTMDDVKTLGPAIAGLIKAIYSTFVFVSDKTEPPPQP